MCIGRARPAVAVAREWGRRLAGGLKQAACDDARDAEPSLCGRPGRLHVHGEPCVSAGHAGERMSASARCILALLSIFMPMTHDMISYSFCLLAIQLSVLAHAAGKCVGPFPCLIRAQLGELPSWVSFLQSKVDDSRILFKGMSGFPMFATLLTASFPHSVLGDKTFHILPAGAEYNHHVCRSSPSGRMQRQCR